MLKEHQPDLRRKQTPMLTRSARRFVSVRGRRFHQVHPADEIIHARWIVPVVPENTFFENHSLVHRNGRIIDILDTASARKKYRHIDRVKERPNHVLLPGLINSHNHAPMALFKDYIFPAEAQWVSRDFVRQSSQLAIGEMIKGGTTTFSDMYFFSEETAREAAQVGMRANIGLTMIDFPTAWASSEDEYISKAIEIAHEFKGNPYVQISLAPHAPYTVSDGLFKRVLTTSQEHNLRVMCHIHETEHEVEESLLKYGMRPIERLNKLGVINDKMLAVHCTQLIDSEMKLFAERGTSVAHCPESNCKLASGVCPVDTLQRHGVNTCIGTDSVASNNELDMFGELKMTAFIGKMAAKDPEACSAARVLSMATINGARAIGLENETGSLQIGKSADMITVNLKSLFTVPVYNPLVHLVYSVGRDSVEDVWIKGKQHVNNKELLTYDEEYLLHLAKRWGDQIYPTFLLQNGKRKGL